MAVGESKVQTHLDLREDPEELNRLQRLRSHILYYLSTYFGEEQLFRKARNILQNQQRGKRQARMNMYVNRSLLTINCGAAANSLKKSSISHKHAGQGVFPGCHVCKGELSGSCYASHVHSDLGREKQLKKI